jgi:hypothetical protein
MGFVDLVPAECSTGATTLHTARMARDLCDMDINAVGGSSA